MIQVKQELEGVAECERFLLLAERENIEKFPILLVCWSYIHDVL